MHTEHKLVLNERKSKSELVEALSPFLLLHSFMNIVHLTLCNYSFMLIHVGGGPQLAEEIVGMLTETFDGEWTVTNGAVTVIRIIDGPPRVHGVLLG